MSHTLQLDTSPSSKFLSLVLPYLPSHSNTLTLKQGDSISYSDGDLKESLDIALKLASESALVGDESRKKEIETWFAYQRDELSPALGSTDKGKLLPVLHKLNKRLEPVVFLVTNKLSLADLALLPLINPTVKGWKPNDVATFENISRWYDNVQHLKEINATVQNNDLFVNLPQTVPKADPKEKGKGQPQEKGQAQGKGKGQPQEKGQGQGKGKGKEKETTTTSGTEPNENKSEKPVNFSRLDIRVGKIIAIEKHPDATALYKEQIDVGEDKPRTVVSGLVNFVPIEELQDRMVILLCNLKPAAMRGIKSEAMLICGSNEDHTKVEVVDPPSGSAPGDKVFVDGNEGLPDGPINLSSKNNIFKTLQEDLRTNSECVAVYKDSPLKTAKGICKVKSLTGAHLS